jgi:uncharacterized membrane protein YvbJ
MADRFCVNCGHELGLEDKFCTNCGRPTHESSATVPPPQDQPRRSGGWSVGRVALLVLVVPVLLAVAVFVFLVAWGAINELARQLVGG